MDNNSEYTSEIFIARWVAGELTETEVDGLHEFMCREPGAMKFFEEIKQVWFGSNPSNLPRGLSKDERWQRLNQTFNLKLKNDSRNGKH